MAKHATNVFIKHSAALEDIAIAEDELFRNPNFRSIGSVEESKALNQITAGAIIIAPAPGAARACTPSAPDFSL